MDSWVDAGWDETGFGSPSTAPVLRSMADTGLHTCMVCVRHAGFHIQWTVYIGILVYSKYGISLMSRRQTSAEIWERFQLMGMACSDLTESELHSEDSYPSATNTINYFSAELYWFRAESVVL